MSKEDWDGQTERRKDNMDLMIAVTNLTMRFDSELGNDTQQGSLKKSISRIDDKVCKINDSIFGTSVEDPGILTKLQEMNGLRKEFDYHVMQDRWLFGLILVMQGWALVKLYLI